MFAFTCQVNIPSLYAELDERSLRVETGAYFNMGMTDLETKQALARQRRRI